MISPSVFTKHKCDSASLKKLFDKPSAEYAEGPMRLVNLLRSRVQEGRLSNLRDYRIYAAIDLSYDAPFNQTTPTLVRNVLDKRMNYEDTLKAVESWGLTQCGLFCDRTNATTGRVEKVLNAPTFFHVLVPLVKSYVTIRLAKLFGDRNNTPLFKYEPLKDTTKNRVVCEVLTDIVQAMTTQFGYSSDLRNAIFKTLMYSNCLLFPREAWFHEMQEDSAGKEHVVREGLRYVQPHPTRMFYDLMHGLSTLNTDTGCEYAGYWNITRFSDLFHNKLLWNRDQIGIGNNWFENSLAGTYFTEVYPCTMQFPSIQPDRPSDRETQAYYQAANDLDKAVFVTEVFCKLVPKDYGLGSYENPVWFRFRLASDDTVMWAEPLAYRPVTWMGYDADDSRSRNPSMALEILPWQDHLGNVLSQILLTVKQNLANVIFYDKNIISADDIRALQNGGELMYRGLNFAGFDSFKNARAGLDVGQAFKMVQLHQSSTAELTNTISTIISIMERLLVMSAQEIGSAASHQQSAQEIRTITANTSTRVAYTGAFIDDAIDAWKKQLVDASLAYMDRDFVSQVSRDIPNLDEALKSLGFENSEDGVTKRGVKGTKDALMLEGFASQRDGPDRGTDTQAATVLMQTIQAVAGNQALAQAVGVEPLLRLLTQAARLGGAPRDFELRGIVTPDQQGAAPGAEDVLKIVNEQLAKPLTEALVKTQEDLKSGLDQAAQAIQATQQGMQQADEQTAQVLAQQAQQLQQTQEVVLKLAQQFQAAMQAPALPPPTQYDSMPPDPADPGAVDQAAGMASPGGPVPL